MAGLGPIIACDPGGASAALDGWPPGGAVAVGVEPEVLDDPPHAVSSNSSEPNPAAAAHPLLRITTLHSRFSGSLGAQGLFRCDPNPNTPETYQTAGPARGFLAAT